MKATDISWAQRVQAVADLLKADADRPDFLLNLSLVVNGDKVSRCIRLVDTAPP